MVKPQKILIAFPFFVLILFLCTGLAYAEANRVGIVNCDTLNVRKSPAVSAEIITKLTKNTKVKVLSSSNEWYQVSYGEIKGWVSGDYLTVREESAGTGTINADDVNIRNKPDLTSDIMTTLKKGYKAEYFDRSGDWYKIQLPDDKFGWVYKKYFTIKESSNSRSAVSDAAPAVEESKSNEENSTEPSNADQLIAYAKKFLGVKYVYGGTSPKGFDCSGFVQYVFKHSGISLERVAANQARHGVKVSKKDLQAGDLVFFDTNGGLNAVEHVGIYIGAGKFIHASSGRTTRKVVISDLTEGFYAKSYMTARRYLK